MAIFTVVLIMGSTVHLWYFYFQFVRSRVGGLRSGPQKCNIELESEQDDTLIFESRFESGNLAKAVQV